MATYRNALEAAYVESQRIDNATGIAAESLLDTWSKRNPLALTDEQVSYMRGVLVAAGATRCLSMFDAAIRGERVLA